MLRQLFARTREGVLSILGQRNRWKSPPSDVQSFATKEKSGRSAPVEDMRADPLWASPVVLPEDFDWQFYLQHNEDLRNAGFTTEAKAVRHFIHFGHRENRKYRDPFKVSKAIALQIRKVREGCVDDFEPLQRRNGRTYPAGEKGIAFTICACNYLAQARTLGDSLQEHNPGYRFIIFLVDRLPEDLRDADLGHEVREVHDLGINNYRDMLVNYDITELSTAVKPFCFSYLFHRHDADRIVYFDPDILFFGDLSVLEKTLQEHDIVLTPHITSPIYDGKSPSEQGILNAGLYNLGFIALKRSQESFDFLRWWSFRLTDQCKIDFCNGVFVDQLWVNFVPLFFRNVGILRHPGYNMGYWNLHERRLGEGRLVNDRDELVFFHFSGYGFDERISKHSDRYIFDQRLDVLGVFLYYIERVFRNGYRQFVNLPFSVAFPGPDEGVNLCGFINHNFGIARACQLIKDGLEKNAIHHNVIGLVDNEKEPVNRYKTTDSFPFNLNILVANPDSSLTLLPRKYLDGRHNIGVWYWEMPEMPEMWKQNAAFFSEVWATTDFLRDVFQRNLGEDTKVCRINLPVEIPVKVDTAKAKECFGIAPDEFLCLFVFDYQSDVHRKNPFAVIETFRKVFPGLGKARLIIKSINATGEDVKKMEAAIDGDGRILHIRDRFDPERHNLLMNASDVYISLHRSEGLGLTLMESILLEKPTLCTGYSGNVDFCLPEWSELVDFEMIDVCEESFYRKLYDGQPRLLWAEPDTEDAVKKLRRIYERHSEYRERAKRGREWIMENYSYARFSTTLKELLKDRMRGNGMTR
jgi:glycosyltransferase involved in cell wall biosynthesis